MLSGWQNRFKIFLGGWIFILLVGEAWGKTCQVSAEVQKGGWVGHAGCLIKIGSKAVLVDEGKEGVSVPGGTSEVIAGRREPAWQTACRETQEEVLHLPLWVTATLTIEKHLSDFGGQFHLFHCLLDERSQSRLKRISAYRVLDGSAGPKQRYIDVKLRVPGELPSADWRFPEQKDKTVKLFQALP